MARARGFTHGGRRARRETSWFEIPATRTALSAIGGTILNSLTTAEKALRPFTIIRTHLELLVESDQSAASEFQLGAVGIAVVSDQASAAGVASVPTPITDADSDNWFLHQYFMANFLFATGAGFDGADGQIYSIDSKAMRKVNDSDDVVVVAEVDTNVSSGLLVSMAGRILIKNH